MWLPPSRSLLQSLAHRLLAEFSNFDGEAFRFRGSADPDLIRMAVTSWAQLSLESDLWASMPPPAYGFSSDPLRKPSQ